MFLYKPENEVDTTNWDILSDREILRQHALLRDAPRGKLQSAIVGTHLFSFAIAPDGRLPPEIWTYIFDLCMPPKLKECARLIPPVLKDPPWIFGRVCSSWRRLSRSMSSLWGTARILYDEEITWALPCALQILPKICKISLGANDGLESSRDKILPYLSRLDVLKWDIKKSPEDALWKLLPPGVFSQISSLSFRLPKANKTGHITRRHPSTKQLFGDIPHLRHLRLVSDRPCLLSTDVPWQQLNSLTLITHSKVPTWVESKWALIRDLYPFSGGSSLTTLELKVAEILLPIILSFDFHWGKLKSFTVHCSSENDCDEVFKVLPHCTGLSHIGFHSDLRTVSSDNIHFQFPPSVMISGDIPTCLLWPTNVWANVRKLDVASSILRGEDFSYLLYRFPLLESLKCSLPGQDSLWIEDDIVFEHLQYLHIQSVYSSAGSMFFSRLTTPALMELHIHMQGSDLVDVSIIKEYIERGSCKLTVFRFVSCKPVPGRFINMEKENATEFLDNFVHATVFDATRIAFPSNIFQCMAMGGFLPLVEELRIGVPCFEVYYALADCRLKAAEKRRSSHRFRVIDGFGPLGSEFPALNLLIELRQRFDVECAYQRG